MPKARKTRKATFRSRVYFIMAVVLSVSFIGVGCYFAVQPGVPASSPRPVEASPPSISQEPAGNLSEAQLAQRILVSPGEVGDAQVVSSRSYVQAGNSSTLYLFGEVRNAGKENLKSVKLKASFYNSSDSVIAVGETFSSTQVLRPNETSPFMMVMRGLEQPARYEVEVVEYSVTKTEPYRDFSVTDVSTSRDEVGLTHVKGTVTNTGSRNVNHVAVVVSFYDAEGVFQAMAYAVCVFTDPLALEPGQKIQFDAVGPPMSGLEMAIPVIVVQELIP